ncbi:hypothetical protein U1Q18_048222 [Sarracenia purpurea var. burkii]
MVESLLWVFALVRPAMKRNQPNGVSLSTVKGKQTWVDEGPSDSSYALDQDETNYWWCGASEGLGDGDRIMGSVEVVEGV